MKDQNIGRRQFLRYSATSSTGVAFAASSDKIVPVRAVPQPEPAHTEGSVLKQVRATQKRLMHMQPEPGFRESTRILGETVVTVEDYTSGRVFDDAICYAFYPVDHTQCAGGTAIQFAKEDGRY